MTENLTMQQRLERAHDILSQYVAAEGGGPTLDEVQVTLGNVTQEMRDSDTFCPWCGAPDPLTSDAQVVAPALRGEQADQATYIDCRMCGYGGILELHLKPGEYWCEVCGDRVHEDNGHRYKDGSTVCHDCEDDDPNVDEEAPDCIHCGSTRTFIRSDGDIDCNTCGGIMPRNNDGGSEVVP